MQLFSNYNIKTVLHYAPLHYVTHIARTAALKSKPALIRDGFEERHFRSKSRNRDVCRGFGNYAFLTLDVHPRILKAKLKAGFPHVAIEVPVDAFENMNYHLCRYNVAMTRQLRRCGKPGWKECESNGRYYGTKQIPIAVTDRDKNALLSKHYGNGTMIEVLVPNQLNLPLNTRITCYHHDDTAVVHSILDALKRCWIISEEQPPCLYNRNDEYISAVADYVDLALKSPAWRGNGLEFDNV